MYTSSSFISITDIRKNISGVIEKLPFQKEKIIFKNNKPTAVLVDFAFYEKLQNNNFNIKCEEIEGSEDFIGTKQHNELLNLMKSS